MVGENFIIKCSFCKKEKIRRKKIIKQARKSFLLKIARNIECLHAKTKWKKCMRSHYHKDDETMLRVQPKIDASKSSTDRIASERDL